MRPPRDASPSSTLARYTPDSRRWRRRVAAVAGVAAPLCAYAAVAIISGVKTGLVYNALIALFGILALTLPAVAAASLLAPPSGRETKTRSAGSDAVEALKHRYAAGEVSDEEFERRLDTLVRTENGTVDDPAAGVEHAERSRGTAVETNRG
ncbi:SHOCT domain-containing protein [Halobellus sp. EA9]|uniref:SHOCT domain-containing protein n=1 Tax=Halobellus sp. EA9 TaxID=3421647 RepID=UPI003EBE8E30